MSAPDWIAQARAEGLAPAEESTGDAARPWSVVLLTGLGAWLAAVPLVLLFGVFFAGAWDRGGTAYVVGAGLTALAVVLLRERRLPLFVEQLALPLLLCGLLSLGWALQRDLSDRLALLVALVLALGLIVLLPASWLRGLLGAAAAALVAGQALMLLEKDLHLRERELVFWVSHAVLLACALVWALQWRLGGDARHAATAAVMEPALSGAWVVGLGLLMLAAGRTFLFGGGSGGFVGELANDVAGVHVFPRPPVLPGVLSALLALVAGLGLQRAWRVERPVALLPPLLVLIALAGLISPLGGALAVLALMLVTGRRRLALAAAVTALWVLGSFYYQWDRPLAHKALVLILAGSLLGAWTWAVTRRLSVGSTGAITATSPAAPRRAVLILALGGVVALGLVNGLIWQKERLIADGRPVFVPLAPVDPRSLMQGDYMRLSYALPGVGWRWPAADRAGWARAGRRDEVFPFPEPLWGHRPRVAVTLDARGIVTAPRLLRPDEAVPAGAQLLELTPKDGGWTLVTDAWFFREGEEARWRPARYGEFRVLPDGRALLVGLVGEDLKPL